MPALLADVLLPSSHGTQGCFIQSRAVATYFRSYVCVFGAPCCESLEGGLPSVWRPQISALLQVLRRRFSRPTIAFQE